MSETKTPESVLGDSWAWKDIPASIIKCPGCGDTYQHPGRVDKGEWRGRGPCYRMHFWGECGSTWALATGFHKGESFLWCEVYEYCNEDDGAINYQEYIRSPEWRAKADSVKEKAGFRCQVCNRHKDKVVLDAHHRTYDRLGNELPEDITVLCRDCHGLYESNKKNGIY